MHENLSDLSNVALWRLCIRTLYNLYDAGGVSLKRSRRSALLEAMMDCRTFFNTNHITGYNFDVVNVCAEMHTRYIAEKSAGLSWEVPSIDLASMEESTIALLLLHRLFVHCADAGILNQTEWRAVYGMYLFCGVSKIYPLFVDQKLTDEHLMDEIQNRINKTNQLEFDNFSRSAGKITKGA